MITIRRIDRTCLDYDALIKVIKNYSSLEHDILIVFDRRISCYGLHTYNHTVQLHTIRISPDLCQYVVPEGSTEAIRLDKEAEKHVLISTLLHELCHAHQRESLKQSFFRRDYLRSKTIKNPEMAEFYSQVELEARSFEINNILKAVELYDCSCV